MMQTEIRRFQIRPSMGRRLWLLYLTYINPAQLFQIDSGNHFLESDDIETCKEAVEVSVATKTLQRHEVQ